jgi:hypothetical protein
MYFLLVVGSVPWHSALTNLMHTDGWPLKHYIVMIDAVTKQMQGLPTFCSVKLRHSACNNRRMTSLISMPRIVSLLGRRKCPSPPSLNMSQQLDYNMAYACRGLQTLHQAVQRFTIP